MAGDDKGGSLTTAVVLTEREAGQLMCLLHGGELVPEREGFNMTEAEQNRLGEKFRKAVWKLYHYRRQHGMTTLLNETGALVPEE